jgi:hypothetical protein
MIAGHEGHSAGSKVFGGSQLTKPLTYGQVGVYDILSAQQEDVSHIDVVGGDIHTEKLLLCCILMLHRHPTGLSEPSH